MDQGSDCERRELFSDALLKYWFNCSMHARTSQYEQSKEGQAKQVAKCDSTNRPAVAQLVAHLTANICSDHMVTDSIPGGRLFSEFESIAVFELGQQSCELTTCLLTDSRMI